MVRYRSVADLNNHVLKWLAQLPQDIEVVVGIPRSGLLVANLIALYRNISMTDVDGLIAGRLLGTGMRYRYNANPLTTKGRVLIVDDSLRTGRQIRIIKEQIAAAHLDLNISYGAVYIEPGSEQLVDFFYERVPTPRMFEWNIMNHTMLREFCLDIDGVLCRDPSKHENDDGDKYSLFLDSADPLNIPTLPVGWFVTSRLEKYRAQTEAWLKQHGVQYSELIMMNYPDKAARQAANVYASFKSDVYVRTRAKLFIESSYKQAVEIAQLSGKPVFCMDTREMIYPGMVSKGRRKLLALPQRMRDAIEQFAET